VLAAPPPAALSNEQIIARARDLGMRPLTELAGSDVTLTVGPGSTAEQVGKALQKAGVLANQSDLLFHVGGRRPKEGIYHLRLDASVESLIQQLFPEE
jgi:cell division protein YceG involved in septum cleavage